MTDSRQFHNKHKKPYVKLTPEEQKEKDQTTCVDFICTSCNKNYSRSNPAYLARKPCPCPRCGRNNFSEQVIRKDRTVRDVAGEILKSYAQETGIQK